MEMAATATLGYQVGLSKNREMVISSHFMQIISQNSALHLYDNHCFQSKRLAISLEEVVRQLVPILKSASNDFCEKRALAAKRRAISRYSMYGYTSEEMIGASEVITEALLDKEFSRNGEKYIDRVDLNDRVQRMIAEKGAVDMTMPALPFKIPSPLKSRGALPDLGEINFLLSVYEIAKTVEIICAAETGASAPIKARFTIISDGSRFDDIVNQSIGTMRDYQNGLAEWIALLEIGEYIKLIDYHLLLQSKLPQDMQRTKHELFRQAHTGYSQVLWPVFDPDDMEASLAMAAKVELDPEHGNAEGRFSSLLKSLVYTVNYKALHEVSYGSADQRSRLYRNLTAHIFYPYTRTTATHNTALAPHVDTENVDIPLETRERLRKAMLTEVWAAAINYIAEIKSDRDLANDPILVCLPDHLRWTIHAKQGQLAIATPPILGMSVQPWAGSAVFRPTSKGTIRLCTLPSLVLEGTQAIPVVLRTPDDSNMFSQPLFYLDKDLEISDVKEFLLRLGGAYTRQRFS